MGLFLDRLWEPRFAEGGVSRRQRASGAYRAYVPDALVGRIFAFEGTVAADIADAERDIARLELHATTLSSTEALARILLRAESVASSRIEGLIVSAQRLLREDVARSEDDETNDATALEVLANVDAMAEAIDDPVSDIDVDRLLAFHKRLMAPTRLANEAGRIRTLQNWIGGTSYNPFSAAFVPPPPEEVPRLLADLCEFCNLDSLPAVAQAAIAHAQFETIHPFIDGNGRTGRALIQMILKRRGLVRKTVPPVSLILATLSHDYVAALQATRYEGPSDSPLAQRSTDDWISLFAGACSRAVSDAEEFEANVRALQSDWRERLGPIRSDASALALIDRLPATPIVTVRSVERALGVSFNAANGAVAALVAAGILTKTRAGRRNRPFEARELIDAFTRLERQMASPDGDTMVSPPKRSVPRLRP